MVKRRCLDACVDAAMPRRNRTAIRAKDQKCFQITGAHDRIDKQILLWHTALRMAEKLKICNANAAFSRKLTKTDA